MDGDVVDLAELASLANEFQALLYLDEAHATGILGERGYGLSTSVDLTSIPHVVMGTFSKGIGVCGAYLACSQTIKEYLINKCAGFIYSTSLSPMVIGAVSKAWEILPSLGEQRKQLFTKHIFAG